MLVLSNELGRFSIDFYALEKFLYYRKELLFESVKELN